MVQGLQSGPGAIALYAHGIGLTAISDSCFSGTVLGSIDLSFNNLSSIADYAFFAPRVDLLDYYSGPNSYYLYEFRCNFCGLRASSLSAVSFALRGYPILSSSYSQVYRFSVIINNELINTPNQIFANEQDLQVIPNMQRRLAQGYGWNAESFNAPGAPWQFKPLTYADYVSKNANLFLFDEQSVLVFDVLPRGFDPRAEPWRGFDGGMRMVHFNTLAIELGAYTGPQGGLFSNTAAAALIVTFTPKTVMLGVPGLDPTTYCPIQQFIIGSAFDSSNQPAPAPVSSATVDVPYIGRWELRGFDLLLPSETPSGATGCIVPDCSGGLCQQWEPTPNDIVQNFSPFIVQPEPALLSLELGEFFGAVTFFTSPTAVLSHDLCDVCTGQTSGCAIQRASLNVTNAPLHNLWNPAMNVSGWAIDPEALCGYNLVLRQVIFPDLPNARQASWTPVQPNFVGLSPERLFSCLSQVTQVFWPSRLLAGGAFNEPPPSLQAINIDVTYYFAKYFYNDSRSEPVPVRRCPCSRKCDTLACCHIFFSVLTPVVSCLLCSVRPASLTVSSLPQSWSTTHSSGTSSSSCERLLRPWMVCRASTMCCKLFWAMTPSRRDSTIRAP